MTPVAGVLGFSAAEASGTEIDLSWTLNDPTATASTFIDGPTPMQRPYRYPHQFWTPARRRFRTPG